LFDHSDRANQILAAERLSEIDKGELIMWFMCSYLPKCYQRCPVSVTRQFDDVSSREKLERAVSAVVEWRRSNVLFDAYDAFEAATDRLLSSISETSVTARSYLVWVKELTTLVSKLQHYLTFVACLHVARKLLRLGFTDRWTKLLSICVTIWVVTRI